MEDNNLNKKTGNLEDKLKNSYDIKDVKKKDTKTQLIIGVFVVIVLMIIFFVARSLGGNKNQIKNDQTKTQDSVKQESNLNGNKNVTKVDEDGKEKQYKIQELSEDKKNKDEKVEKYIHSKFGHLLINSSNFSASASSSQSIIFIVFNFFTFSKLNPQVVTFSGRSWLLIFKISIFLQEVYKSIR